MKTILIYYIEIVKQRCDNVLFIIQVRQCSLQDKIRLTHLQVMHLLRLRTGRALLLSALRQEHVSHSPALHREVSVLTPHCTGQGTKDPGHHSLGSTAQDIFPIPTLEMP